MVVKTGFAHGLLVMIEAGPIAKTPPAVTVMGRSKRCIEAETYLGDLSSANSRHRTSSRYN